MRRALWCGLLTAAVLLGGGWGSRGDAREFLRGDANADGRIDISDPIFLLGWLFYGDEAPLCEGLSNANASRGTDISDVITLLNFLFRAGPAPPPMTSEELAACERAWEVRRGREVYENPDAAGNAYSCALCHGTERSTDPPADGLRRPAHGLGDVLGRPSYFGGRTADFLEAANWCRRDWMDAPAWTAESAEYQALLTFLSTLPGASDPAPEVSVTIVPPAATGPATGDAVRGCELFALACASCHGPEGEGVADLGPSLWETPPDADTVRAAIRLSGPNAETVPGTHYEGLLGTHMPFWSAERMSDGEIEDIARFLEVAADPTRRSCDRAGPQARLVRSGTFRTFLHNVSGRAEEWDIEGRRTIRLVDFFYDGQGPPEVLVWLYQKTGRFDDIFQGVPISEDLHRPFPYLGVTMEFEIPPELTDEEFNTVAIWCTAFELNYGEALLLAR